MHYHHEMRERDARADLNNYVEVCVDEILTEGCATVHAAGNSKTIQLCEVIESASSAIEKIILDTPYSERLTLGVTIITAIEAVADQKIRAAMTGAV